MTGADGRSFFRYSHHAPARAGRPGPRVRHLGARAGWWSAAASGPTWPRRAAGSRAKWPASSRALTARLDLGVRSISASASTVRAAEQGDAAATRALFDQVAAARPRGGRRGPGHHDLRGAHHQPVAWTGAAGGCARDPPRRARRRSFSRRVPRAFSSCGCSRSSTPRTRGATRAPLSPNSRCRDRARPTASRSTRASRR